MFFCEISANERCRFAFCYAEAQKDNRALNGKKARTFNVPRLQPPSENNNYLIRLFANLTTKKNKPVTIIQKTEAADIGIPVSF